MTGVCWEGWKCAPPVVRFRHQDILPPSPLPRCKVIQSVTNRASIYIYSIYRIYRIHPQRTRPVPSLHTIASLTTLQYKIIPPATVATSIFIPLTSSFPPSHSALSHRRLCASPHPPAQPFTSHRLPAHRIRLQETCICWYFNPGHWALSCSL